MIMTMIVVKGRVYGRQCHDMNFLFSDNVWHNILKRTTVGPRNEKRTSLMSIDIARTVLLCALVLGDGGGEERER